MTNLTKNAREDTLPRWAQALLGELRTAVGVQADRAEKAEQQAQEARALLDGQFEPHPVMDLVLADDADVRTLPVPRAVAAVRVRFRGLPRTRVYEIRPEMRLVTNMETMEMDAVFTGEVLVSADEGPMVVVAESGNRLRLSNTGERTPVKVAGYIRGS